MVDQVIGVSLMSFFMSHDRLYTTKSVMYSEIVSSGKCRDFSLNAILFLQARGSFVTL